MSNRKPDFLIIGAPRCGTTYLAQNLADHPDVFMSTGNTEDIAGDVHFFDATTEQGSRNIAKGTEWYFGLFAGAGNAKAVGEKTADYLLDPDAPTLIANTLGKPRIIVMIRDPVDRAWSHFCHSRHRLPSHLGFHELVRQGTDFGDVPVLTAGLYARHLQPYIDHFGTHNILILVKEDLDRAPGPELARACSFLGINSDYEFPHLQTYMNAGSSSSLATVTARVGRAFKTRLPRPYMALMQSPLSGPIVFLIRVLRRKTDQRHTNNSRSGGTRPDSRTRNQLREYYRDDVHRMSIYMDRDLANLWWNYNPDNS